MDYTHFCSFTLIIWLILFSAISKTIGYLIQKLKYFERNFTQQIECIAGCFAICIAGRLI